jgi:hypothetical protein
MGRYKIVDKEKVREGAKKFGPNSSSGRVWEQSKSMVNPVFLLDLQEKRIAAIERSDIITG